MATGAWGASELRDAASVYADPLQYRIIPAHTIDSKPMPTAWAPGKAPGIRSACAAHCAPYQQCHMPARSGVGCVPTGGSKVSEGWNAP